MSGAIIHIFKRSRRAVLIPAILLASGLLAASEIPHQIPGDAPPPSAEAATADDYHDNATPEPKFSEGYWDAPAIEVVHRIVGSPTQRYPLFRAWGEQPDLEFPAIQVDALDDNWCRIRIPLAPDESIWGLGQQHDAFDLVGRRITSWISGKADEGDASRYAVPFFISSAGYGLFVNSTGKVLFDIGASTPDELTIVNPDAGAELIVFYGSPADISKAYTALVGRPKPLPEWAFRPWFGRSPFMGSYEVNRALRRFLELEMPVAAVLLDQWSDAGHHHNFDRARYPNPITWMRRLKQQGVHVVCHVPPEQERVSDAHEDALYAGYLVRNENDVGTFQQPAARDWWRDALRPLTDMGVSGFILTSGRPPLDTTFHNQQPFYYQQASLEPFTMTGQEGVLLADAANPMTTRHMIHLASAQPSDWNGLAATVRGGLSAALSGYPYWAHSVGGFTGTPEKHLYIRWLQLGVFSPIFLIHGDDGREPWRYDPETVAIAQFYFGVRERLLPLLLEWADIARTDGAPILRPLIWHYADDPNVHGIDDQFLLGPDLLIAPVTTPNAARMIYLPQGEWIDAWNHSLHQGPTRVIARPPLHQIPTYYRSSAQAQLADLFRNPPESPREPIAIELAGRTNERGVVPRLRYVRDTGAREHIIYRVTNHTDEIAHLAVRLAPTAGIDITPHQVVRFSLEPEEQRDVVFEARPSASATAGTYPLMLEAWPEPGNLGDLSVAMVLSPSWKAIGPIPGGVGSEQTVKGDTPIDFEAVYLNAAGQTLRWKDVPGTLIGEDGLIDVGAVTGHDPYSTTYLHTTVFSPWPRRATFWAGSGDAMTIWLNGRELADVPAHRHAERDEDGIPAVLVGGRNTILIRISRDLAPNHFYFRME